ncbi:MAG: MFS transporter [Pseudonocardiales bacterium]|nr:MAG: MFS transporter [Pseudonocardiales bacterium]
MPTPAFHAVARVLPDKGPMRVLAGATFLNTIGTGLWITGSVLFFTRSVGLSAAQVGIGMSVAGFVSLAAGLPLGHLADRFGARRVVVVLLTIWAADTAAYALVHSFWAFVIVICIDSVAGAGASAARGALIAGLFAGAERVRVRADLRAVTNLGISLGAVGAGFALHADSRTAYLGLVFADVATFLFAAGGYLLLPHLPPTHTTSSQGSPWQAARDMPYVGVTVLNGLLSVQYEVLAVALPLWLAHYTSAPRWTFAPLLMVNTIMIILLQVRASRGAQHLAVAQRAVLRSGWAFAGAALIFLAAHWASAAFAVLVLAVAVVVHTIGELWQAAAAFGISFELAPAHAQGQYQGLFGMGMGLAQTVGPAMLTLLTITWGPPGWIIVAGFFLLTSHLLPPAIRWAERTRVVQDQVAVA